MVRGSAARRRWHNPADRDHCIQYIAAVGLIYGRLTAEDYEDHIAADPRIDRLRAKMRVTISAQYTRELRDPGKRANAHVIEIRLMICGSFLMSLRDRS